MSSERYLLPAYL